MARDARVVVPHRPDCDGRWRFATKYVDSGEEVRSLCCDSAARRDNGGFIYYEVQCVASFRCPALARVRKGALQDYAVTLIEAES